jgi:hypothetical protein
MPRPRTALLLAAIALAPAIALAIDYYENGLEFEGTGSLEVIVRDTGWFDGQLDPAGEPIEIEGPSIELECEPTVPDGYAGPYIPSVHAVLSIKDARRVAAILEDAADAAEAP